MPKAGASDRALHLRRNRIVPRVKISNELAADLSAIATKAFLRVNTSRKGDDEYLTEQQIMIHATVPLVAEQAIRHFLEERAFEIPLPKLRALVKADGRLANSIRKLYERLPGDEAPPFAQMRSLYCYGNAESDGLDDDSVDDREDVWDTRFGPAAVRTALARWLNLIEELHSQTGKGRSPVSAQFGFVRTLAAYWTDTLKAPLGSSRNETNSPKPGGRVDQHGQRGLFAQFVYKVAEGILEEFGGKLEWDTAIREISEKKG
jgi:hypothetical protein